MNDELIIALHESIGHLRKIEMGNNNFNMVLKLTDKDYQIIAQDILDNLNALGIETLEE